MKIIGLDLSINSTGICIYEDGKLPRYYIVTCSDKKSKKMMELIEMINDKRSIPLRYYIYKKSSVTSIDYSDKERSKTYNINTASSIILDIIKKEKPDHAFIEGISYGSVGSAALADLSGLNFVIRWILSTNNIMFTIVAPTELKKLACGNGKAEKSEMMYAWEACDDRLKSYKDKLKFDDIADAYFLTQIKKEL